MRVILLELFCVSASPFLQASLTQHHVELSANELVCGTLIGVQGRLSRLAC